jgi:DNA-binding PadR family transcriptional regulator
MPKAACAKKEHLPPRRYYELTAGGRQLAGEARSKAMAITGAGQRLFGAVPSEG